MSTNIDNIKAMEKDVKDFETLKEEYEEMEQMPCKPAFGRYRTGEIIDENQTARWNREQVEKNHAEYSEEEKRMRKAKNARRIEIVEGFCTAICAEVEGLTLEKAPLLWCYAWDRGHADGIHQVISELKEVCELANDILRP